MIRNYFDEYADYDCNGNITRLRRCGLVDNMHCGFGLVDNLYMTYEGNMLTSVRDNASRYSYAGATDFDGVSVREYPLTYNDAGSLVSDAGRKIARIDYDLRNNPVRIQFTNGNVTKYVYSATGEKLRVIYQTAVPNITVAIGCMRELAFYEIQHTDSTDYLLGGSLTLKNGRIDKYLFDEGYCQAEKYVYNASKDNFTFCYFDRDHLGNIRQVREVDGSREGTVIQSMDYYPFGVQFCHSGTDNNVQPYRYNGKEYDKMHGLNTYDYGARQYNPITARWDRVDPLAEKDPGTSPYVYAKDNPMRYIDHDGMWSWPWERKSLITYSGNGLFKLNMNNFSASTRSTFQRMNNAPHYWQPNEIGINTEVGKVFVKGHHSYALSHKPVGIEEKQTSLDIKIKDAASTGLPDRRFKSRSISPVRGAKGAGAMLALDLVVATVDQYSMLSNFWDSNALENQTASLRVSYETVSINSTLIPDKYKQDTDIIGAIVNYVFQGINSTKNRDVEIIGNRILFNSGRYDKEKEQYMYFIQQ